MNDKIIGMIKDRVSPKSTVTILGYTDRIGSDELNKALSERRALSVKSALNLEKAEPKENHLV